MKKIVKARLVNFFGVFLITSGLILGGSLQEAASPVWLTGRDYIETSVSPSATQNAARLFADDMDAIAQTLDSQLTWWGSDAGTVSSDRRQMEAEVYAVGGPFDEFHSVRMQHGSFLSPVGENGSSIVLESNLAWQLFGTTDAVGMTVEFSGKTYIVTGVYQKDTSLLGILSDNGKDRAYIGYDDSVSITGMEASLTQSLPGKSLQAVRDALSKQGKTADAFLFRDVTESAQMDAETAGLPALVFTMNLTVILIFFIRCVVSGMTRGLRAFMRETYFSDSWPSVLRHAAGMAITIAAAAGLIYALWLAVDFPFFLPGRFVPGSWIDAGFYKNLLQTQAKEAIAAMEFIPQHWRIARDAGMQIAGYMNMISLAGMAVFGVGTALLRESREAQTEKSLGLKAAIMDIPVIWIFLIISVGASGMISLAMGLQTVLPFGRMILLCAGFTIWAGWILYKARIPKIIYFGKNMNLSEQKENQ